jgi:MSHA biogenesis protein MshM
MYLDHFRFKELPFTLTPNIGFFCNIKGHQEALNTLLFSIKSGEGFIKIIGEVGAGKTLLCRKVLDSLPKDYFSAYIPNPDLTPIELRRALARELGIDLVALQDQHELLTLINNRLLELNTQNKHVVLLIDEAQAIPSESLETLRLLTNLETATTKLLQVVLFGQPELDDRLNLPNFRQLKQRISFSYYLPLMTREDLDSYLFHRLAMAGYTLGSLFSNKARDILYSASKGIPRVVNILCHKALLAAYGRDEAKVTHKIMQLAVRDTDIALKTHKSLVSVIVGLVMLIVVVFAIYVHQGIL